MLTDSFKRGPTMLRYWAVLAAAAFTIVTMKAAVAAPRMGIAQVNAKGSACIAIRGAAVRAGDAFWIVLFDPPRIVDGTIASRSAQACSLLAHAEGDKYVGKLRFTFGSDEVGIAVFASGARAEYVDGEFVLNTPDAKTPISFRVCSSQEGLHYSTWRGNRRTWEEYLYLGYDLEVTCTEEERGE